MSLLCGQRTVSQTQQCYFHQRKCVSKATDIETKIGSETRKGKQGGTARE